MKNTRLENKKTALIIYGSPKDNGDISVLVNEFVKNFDGQTKTVYAFPHRSNNNKGILPCIDCGYCSKNIGCCLNDEFDKIIDDVYDVVVLACPVYDYCLPGPVMNIISRFNSFWHNHRDLGVSRKKTKKTGVLLLTAGGTEFPPPPCETKLEDISLYYAKWIFKTLGASIDDEHSVLALSCDKVPIKSNLQALEKVKNIANMIS